MAALAAACMSALPAAADPCEPDGGGCHPTDCLEYDPFREVDQVLHAAGTGDPQQVGHALDGCY